MALRVLLADESNTIKRVIELSLQDYAVEVRPVHIGTDVLQIAKSYRPDIILADILLQKLSGYEVCRLIKSDPQLARIPVVLMWSGFMDFDEQKFRSSGAEAKLEKPFNSDNLRGLVQNFVNKTKSQTLSKFITLPEFIDDSEAPEAPTPIAPTKPKGFEPKKSIQIDDVDALEVDTTPPTSLATPAPSKAAQTPQKWNMDSFESIESFSQKMAAESSNDERHEEFSQVRLGKKPEAANMSPADFPTADSWIQQDINRFKAPEPIDEEKTIMDSLSDPEPASNPLETFNFGNTSSTPKPSTKTKKIILDELSDESPTSSLAQISPNRAEEILVAQAREVLERVAWKIVPDLAEKIIREEIKRLLNDKDDDLSIE